ncbi:MAG: hypothetical protein HZA91_20910 [Verrucomicrobia bacterium]|nr:hypothetical protein [Verrucomicrobiota bacterium]
MKTKSVVGDLIDFRGLVYSPVNENGVIFLFGKVAHDLNMYIEEIKPGFPDCTARRFTGKGWERVDIEFEYQSLNFKAHGHDAKDCSIIVCWEHNWPGCPVEVIALRDIIPNLPNEKITRPGQIEKATSLEALLNLHDKKIGGLVEKTRDTICALSKDIWFKHNDEDLITFYSPKRVFVYLHLYKKRLGATVFTRGRSVRGVEPFEYKSGGAKWGYVELETEKDVAAAERIFCKSFELINAAISEKETTGWYAPIENERDPEKK